LAHSIEPSRTDQPAFLIANDHLLFRLCNVTHGGSLIGSAALPHQSVSANGFGSCDWCYLHLWWCFAIGLGCQTVGGWIADFAEPATTGEGLAPASCDHHIKLLRQSFSLAIEWDQLDKNPAAKVKILNIQNSVQHDLDEKISCPFENAHHNEQRYSPSMSNRLVLMKHWRSSKRSTPSNLVTN